MFTNSKFLDALVVGLMVALLLTAQQSMAGPKTTGLDDEDDEHAQDDGKNPPRLNNTRLPPVSLFNFSPRGRLPRPRRFPPLLSPFNHGAQLTPSFSGLGSNSNAGPPGPTPGVPIAAGFQTGSEMNHEPDDGTVSSGSIADIFDGPPSSDTDDQSDGGPQGSGVDDQLAVHERLETWDLGQDHTPVSIINGVPNILSPFDAARPLNHDLASFAAFDASDALLAISNSVPGREFYTSIMRWLNYMNWFLEDAIARNIRGEDITSILEDRDEDEIVVLHRRLTPPVQSASSLLRMRARVWQLYLNRQGWRRR